MIDIWNWLGMEMRDNDRQNDGGWYECHPNVTSETRIQSQFCGLFKTSPGTIRDAEKTSMVALLPVLH